MLTYDRDYQYPVLLGKVAHMPGTTSPRECSYHISVNEHPFVPDQGSVATFLIPFRRKFDQVQSAVARPELDGEIVFPGAKRGSPLSTMAILKALQRMGRTNIIVHGFRSTFRDWAAEQTSFPREVAEEALAHTNRNAVEAAYRRSDLLEKRAKLMAAWAKYCDAPSASAEITELRPAMLSS